MFMIDGNKLGTVGFAKLGTPYKTMDCQAFVEWCLAQCGMKKDLAGSNAWFREVNQHGAIMTPEECVAQLGRVPAGAFLFILDHDGGEPAKYKPDGLGNASHIGIVTGQGEGAIHSSASRGCVAESRFKGKTIRGGWNRVGLWEQVCYDYGGGSGAGSGSGSDSNRAFTHTEESANHSPTGTESNEGSTGDFGHSGEYEDVSANHSPTGSESNEGSTGAFARNGEYARVISPNGKPVNTRQGPGTGYGLSKAGKLPVETLVEILKRRAGWCRIRVTDNRDATWYCWIMEEFLQTEGSAGESVTGTEADSEQGLKSPVWTVTIPYLTETEARLLAESYPGAMIMKSE